MKKLLLTFILFATAQISYCQYQITSISPFSVWEFKGKELTNMQTVAFQYGFVQPISTKTFGFAAINLGANFQTEVTPNISLVIGVAEDFISNIPAIGFGALYDGYSHSFGVALNANFYTTVFGSSHSPAERMAAKHKYNSLLN